MLDPNLKRIFESIIRGAQGNFDHFQGQAKEFARQFNLLARDIERVEGIAVEASAAAQEVGSAVAAGGGGASSYVHATDSALFADFVAPDYYEVYGEGMGSPHANLDSTDFFVPALNAQFDPRGYATAGSLVSDYWGVTFPSGTYLTIPAGYYDIVLYAKFTPALAAGYFNFGIDYGLNSDFPAGGASQTPYWNQVASNPVDATNLATPEFLYQHSIVSTDVEVRLVPYMYAVNGAEDAALDLDQVAVTIYKVR